MRRLASDLRVRSQSYNLFVLTRKCDSYIYVHQRLLRSMQRPPQGPSEQRKGIFQGFEHPNIQKSSFNDEMERSELELDQTTYSEDFSVSHFVGNRGGGANAGQFRTMPTPQTRESLRPPPPQTSLFTRAWISRPTNPAYSMFGCTGEDSCGEAGKQRISICRR